MAITLKDAVNEKQRLSEIIKTNDSDVILRATVEKLLLVETIIERKSNVGAISQERKENRRRRSGS